MRITALIAYGALAWMAAPVVDAEPAPGAAADPAHAGARVPEIRYDSAFQNYVPYREQPLETWRDINDEVGRAGGHIGLFGGSGHGGGHAAAKPAPGAAAAGPKGAAGQAPARGTPAAPASHSGHH